MDKEPRKSLSLAREASKETATKPLILLCDGTWCGRETNTRTNIYKLAEMVGISIKKDSTEWQTPEGVYYIEGVGLGSSFLDYIFNGATAQDLANQCIEAYEFIVHNYTYPHHEIWMFGLSRGAYLARAVAGMINNCGIVHPITTAGGSIDRQQTRLLCETVYNLYRSSYTINAPHSAQSLHFRRTKSWPLVGDEDPDNPKAPRFLPPIKFMGLFDTVGSLGIPEFTGGVGLDWPTFYDQNVSTVVANVHHAVSLHDRLFIFQPCLVSRSHSHHCAQDWDQCGVTRQEWLPGVHYDLGRQRFRFLREFGGGWLESLLTRFKFASKVIEPNHVLADFALRWMLLAVQQHRSAAYEVIPDINQLIDKVTLDIHTRAREPGRTGDGDVYGHILAYAPFGSLILNIWRAVKGTRGQVSSIYQLFFDLRDRLIPEDNAVISKFRRFDEDIPGCIENLGEVSEQRYPSKAYAKWNLRQ
ncbi:T6SS phospholipase effector Tle1-like catalytic domain-containing protein [Aspergillus homomorphus CBS 101889]|uniref:T6SS Phospholipase effector Tle1-like catalytic domain-containing protein n=1 Tax=Aspergillus homomorphus (strain CBS 101889) TaxID=1450537 RepID=A0A395I4M5_ASPHC|nr:hypothetical protein BO97DRAFT_363849 [Aspergillus homomorphus CBS 101889]RAL15162.1 hypothetical protein BO97DRAFT_363849 [Aspergillus homomorphus CBS 101889]